MALVIRPRQPCPERQGTWGEPAKPPSRHVFWTENTAWAGLSPYPGSNQPPPYYTRETHPLPGPLPFSCEGEVHCCHGSVSLPWQESCTFPVNRFRVSAKFSAVCTVPDALGVDGTRSTYFPRFTVFAFPSTFSPSFQLFSPSFQLFAPFRTSWPLTGHVPRFSPG
jgi:hypothetical protein